MQENDPANLDDTIAGARYGSGADARSGDTSQSSGDDTVMGTLVGRRLSDYQVLRKLGRGGMADVYAAKHLSLGRDVALKVLRRDFARDQDYVDRFRREARAAAKISHANIVAVYDVGNVDGMYFIAQELIDGENLKQSLERNGPIDIGEAVDILISVGSALETAADAGITHRDIKPENIMRSSRGVVKVADFGLARLGLGSEESRADLTQAGLTLGTPRYMSPEQIQGKAVDIRSDLYSLGVSMYHLLSGHPPFGADEPLALAVMHLHETPEPLDRKRSVRDSSGNPDLPEWLIAVIERLMAKSPGDRFQTPSELLDAVRNEASSSSISPTLVGPAAATIRLQRAADAAKRQRIRRLVTTAALGILPFLFFAAAFFGYQRISSAKDVTQLLEPEAVRKADTVQLQYLTGMQRNDEAGWKSVSEFFPESEGETNRTYSAKSKLQLARLYRNEDNLREAEQLLRKLIGNPDVSRLYRVLAMIEQCKLFAAQDKDELSAAKTRLRSEFDQLSKDNRDNGILQRVTSDDDRSELGLIN